MEYKVTLAELDAFAKGFWPLVGSAKVFALHGEMGAGKTTLVHALCEALGVKEAVTSPTFSLINEYAYPAGILYHMDLYRMRSGEEARRAGIEDCIYSGDICLVEWPEKAPGIFPPDTVHLIIEAADDGTRTIKIRMPG